MPNNTNDQRRIELGTRKDKQTVVIARTLSDVTNLVTPGTFVLFVKEACEKDSMLMVSEAIRRGAIGILFEKTGRLDHGIVAASELGVPITSLNKNIEQLDTGELYKGVRKLLSEIKNIADSAPAEENFIPTVHPVKINLGFPITLSKFPALSKLVDGVAFARLEFVITEIIKGEHPLAYISRTSERKFISLLAEQLTIIAKEFSGKPVWFRTDDFCANQLLTLIGGKEREVFEANEYLGWRGIRRSLDQPSWITLQFLAIKELVDKGFDNIGIFPPMTSSVEEYLQWIKLAEKAGLNSKIVKFGIMVETPACALTFEDFTPHLSFVVFGTNDLTQFTLAIDRSNPRLENKFIENSKAVLALMKRVITICKENNIETTVGGQAGFNVDFIKELLGYGLTGTSVTPRPATIQKFKKLFQEYEKNN